MGMIVADSELARYARAMRNGIHSTLVAIEQKHGLYGYPPELVSIGLKAIDEGLDPDDAISAAYTGDDRG